MNDSNFLLGLFAGKFLFGGKKNSQGKSSGGGFFSTVIGFAVIIVLVIIGLCYGLKGVITTLVLFLVVFPVTVGLIRGGQIAKERQAEEIESLFRDGQYTLALDKAEKLYRDNPRAANICGLCYFNGLGCSKNFEKAFMYFENAYKHNIESKTYYGYMLYNGFGCTQDLQKGYDYLSSVVISSKFPLACMHLAEILLFDEKRKNYKEGVKYMRIASDAGLPYAQFQLGLAILSDDSGEPIDEEQGMKYIYLSANAGCTDAIQFIESMEKNQLE